jgi:hypothetical protein
LDGCSCGGIIAEGDPQGRRAKPLGSGAADYDRVVALEGRHGFAGAKWRQSGKKLKAEGGIDLTPKLGHIKTEVRMVLVY